MGTSRRQGPIASLERLLASEVVRTLVERQHLRVARSSYDSLCDELEASIVPMLTSVTPYLIAAHPASLVTVAATSPGGSHDGFGDGNADEAVAVMVDGIQERIAHSNHVDDLFVDEATIRRHALRSVRRVLFEYLKGELKLEADSLAAETLLVSLDGLGYVVGTASTRSDAHTFRAALARAADACDSVLEEIDLDGRTALFRPRTPRASLLALEEAIAAEVGALVDAGLIHLPNVEQEFVLPRLGLKRGSLTSILSDAADELERRAACHARCDRVGARRIRLSITPLDAEAAGHADSLLEELVFVVEALLERAQNLRASTDGEGRGAESQVRRRTQNVAEPEGPSRREASRQSKKRPSASTSKSRAG